MPSGLTTRTSPPSVVASRRTTVWARTGRSSRSDRFDARIVEALLLLALEHRLEPAADDAIDDEAGDQEDPEDDRARG